MGREHAFITCITSILLRVILSGATLPCEFYRATIHLDLAFTVWVESRNFDILSWRFEPSCRRKLFLNCALLISFILPFNATCIKEKLTSYKRRNGGKCKKEGEKPPYRLGYTKRQTKYNIDWVISSGIEDLVWSIFYLVSISHVPGSDAAIQYVICKGRNQ